MSITPKKNDLIIPPQRKNRDQIDRIKAYYILGEKLNPTDEAKRKNLVFTFGKLRDGGSQSKIVEEISKEARVSERTAYTWIKEAKRIFGDIQSAEKAAEIFVLSEQLNHIAKKAVDAGEYNAAVRALDKIIKINGYNAPDSGVDPDTFRMPGTIEYTTDVTAMIEVEDDADPS